MKQQHFLCVFRRRVDATGKLYYAGTLGNSRLLLFPGEDGELAFYLGRPLVNEKNAPGSFQRRDRKAG
jgi:hypothetical protein